MTLDAVSFTNFNFTSEGLRLMVFMARPKEERPCPLVLVNHGGGGLENAYLEMCLELAETGYVGVAMAFRGFDGSEGNQEYGKGEIRDILNLVAYLRSESGFVDQSRIGMLGYSRGALKTLLAAQRSQDFKAVAIWAAPVEMRMHHGINPFIEDLIGGGPDELPEEYQMRSPIYFVDRVSCPVLIIHGEMDEVIPVQHAYMLADELKKRNKAFEIKTYPREGHVFTQQAFSDAWQETVSFLNRYLL